MQKLKSQLSKLLSYRVIEPKSCFKSYRAFELSSYSATLWQRGIAALPTVIIIGTLVLLIAVALISSGVIENAISSGHSQSQEAYVAAEFGAQDAIMRIARDKDFESAGYQIIAGNGTANIMVSGTTTKTIVSTGTVSNKTRKLQVVVNVGVCNGGTNDGNACAIHTDCPSGGCGFGKLKQVSWEEVTN